MRTLSARAGLVMLAVLSSLIAAGCGSIQITDSPPPPSTDLSYVPNTGEQHDLSIAAVDFDPSLDIDRIMANEPINLLVGIENKGNRREAGDSVHISLFNGDRSQLVLTDTQPVPILAAGDLTVVHFTRTDPLARFNDYVLQVDLDPVSHETNLINNHRTLTIDVRALH